MILRSYTPYFSTQLTQRTYPTNITTIYTLFYICYQRASIFILILISLYLTYNIHLIFIMCPMKNHKMMKFFIDIYSFVHPTILAAM